MTARLSVFSLYQMIKAVVAARYPLTEPQLAAILFVVARKVHQRFLILRRGRVFKYKMIKLSPKKALKLAEQLHKQILDWIISGELREGDKIPSENELCNFFWSFKTYSSCGLSKITDRRIGSH